MVNFASWTYCNTFWDMFETSNNVTNYGPPAPYLQQKCFNPYKKSMESFSGNIISVSRGI